VEKLFARIVEHFPDRVVFHCANEPEWINNNVAADLWIVPWIGLGAAQHLAKPFVVCLHDLAYIHVPALAATGKQTDGAARVLAHKAAAVICNCSYICTWDALCYLRIPPTKIHVIRPAAPIEEYAGMTLRGEREFRRYYGLDKSYFVFPSIVRPHKNHIRLIDAFFRFAQRRGADDLGPYLVFTDHVARLCWNNALRELGDRYESDIVNRVKCLGRLPARDIPALYKYAAGTVVPTLFEGNFPFPVLESLTMETPVAFSRIPMAMEAIDNPGDFIIFDPYDVADIERAIGELWECKTGLAAKQRAALGGLLERTWQDVAREYYGVIDRVLGRAAPEMPEQFKVPL
jgi:glycosyltransferase involved in cell wall biosynthesis